MYVCVLAMHLLTDVGWKFSPPSDRGTRVVEEITSGLQTEAPATYPSIIQKLRHRLLNVYTK